MTWKEGNSNWWKGGKSTADSESLMQAGTIVQECILKFASEKKSKEDKRYKTLDAYPCFDKKDLYLLERYIQSCSPYFSELTFDRILRPSEHPYIEINPDDIDMPSIPTPSPIIICVTFANFLMSYIAIDKKGKMDPDEGKFISEPIRPDDKEFKNVMMSFVNACWNRELARHTPTNTP